MNKYNKILAHLLENSKDWSELKQELEKYNTPQSLVTKKTTIAGKIFEFFAYYYFKLEPSKTEIYENVWLYDNIPLETKKMLNLPDVDHGIDLLLQDFDKKYHAVQCKFKNDESTTLSWSGDKIANVFALGTNCDKIIVFTNAAEITSVAKAFEDKFELIDYNDLYSIENDIFESIYKLSKGQAPKSLKLFEPKKHQKKAIDNVIKHFSKSDRGQLILPCGAGKTLTALWIKEKIQSKKTLVLVPSLALLRQIKNDWSKQKRSAYRYICVCSEKDIDKDKTDSLNVHTYEIGGPVTTNIDDVQKFLSRNQDIVVFSTYQSSLVISEASRKIDNFEFDLIICDEAHRTAGSKEKNTFTIVHNNLKIKALKRLYMTATPKVVSTRLKARLAEDYELLCDMSNPDIYGDEAYRMSFGKAINEGILVDYQIIGIGVTDKQIKEYIDKRKIIGQNFSIDEIANNYALDLVMNKYGAFHSLSFHSRVEYAETFSNRHKELFPNVFSSSVNGKQRTTIRSKTLRDFRNSKLGLVSNARCLTEGIDVPTIDMIYFCDPKSSKIDIVQASGRALRTDKEGKKKTGYIVVPIFHHSKDNVESEIKRKPIFNHLIQVIRSLCDQDERLQAEIDNIAFEKGEKNNSKIRIDFPDDQSDKVVKLLGIEKKVKDVLFDEIIKKSKNNWEVMFKKLTEYKKTFGHTSVTRAEDKYLSFWVGDQRRHNRKNQLASKKKEKLNSIGFDWKSEYLQGKDYDDIWIENYEYLIEYIKNHGDANVPARYKKNGLGLWVVNQRSSKKKNSLPKAREELLNEIGFVWKPKDGFEQFCKGLLKFKKKYGHTEIPTYSKDFPKIGVWNSKYRCVLNNGELRSDGSMKYRSLILTSDQIRKLHEIGFVQSVKTTGWGKNYNELFNFYKKHGHSNPNSNENARLYVWCKRIRKNIKKLEPERKELLAKIDFNFEIEKSKSKTALASLQLASRNYNEDLWDKRYNELKQFYNKFEHSDYKKNSGNVSLYHWTLTQRAYRKKGLLSEYKIQSLDKIKFNWKPSTEGRKFRPQSDQWLKMFNQLKIYKKKFGDTNVSQLKPEYKALGRWVNDQRVLKKGRKDKEKIVYLPKDRELLLDSIGFIWDRLDYRFNLKLVSLIEYKNKNGHFNIQPSDEGYKNLYYWLNKQKKEGLEAKRAKQLQEIGFDTSDFPIKEDNN